MGSAAVDPGRRNVELKAVDPDPAWALRACRALGAVDHGVIVQRDTYFNVRRGGLKLREESPGSPHLIQFERASSPEPRLSRYRIVGLDDGEAALAALSAALGVRTVVAKRRRLLLCDAVRIHLDEVENLGSFIELEAVASPDSDLSREHAQIAELRRALHISDERLCPAGYADFPPPATRERRGRSDGPAPA